MVLHGASLDVPSQYGVRNRQLAMGTVENTIEKPASLAGQWAWPGRSKLDPLWPGPGRTEGNPGKVQSLVAGAFCLPYLIISFTKLLPDLRGPSMC